MTLLDSLKALLAEREEHLRSVERIDRELTAAREMLGIPPRVTHQKPVPAAVSMPTVTPFSDARPCERCGEPFTPARGSAGRFCSRNYYAAVPPDERRRYILASLDSGPRFAAAINEWPGLEHVSRSTIHNDLHKLKRDGLVVACDAGYQLPAAPAPALPEVARDDADQAPFPRSIRR